MAGLNPGQLNFVKFVLKRRMERTKSYQKFKCPKLALGNIKLQPSPPTITTKSFVAWVPANPNSKSVRTVNSAEGQDVGHRGIVGHELVDLKN